MATQDPVRECTIDYLSQTLKYCPNMSYIWLFFVVSFPKNLLTEIYKYEIAYRAI